MMDYQVTGDVEQAAIVYNTLRNIETEHRGVALAQVGQKAGDDDPYTNDITFKGRLKQLDEQHAAVVKEHRDLMPTVKRLAEQQAPALPPEEGAQA